MNVRACFLFLTTTTLCSIVAEESKSSCEDGLDLWEQDWRSSSITWKPLRNLRTYEQSCTDDAVWRLTYSQRRATVESKVGNHFDALVFADWRVNRYYNEKELPQSARPEPAVSYIVDRSDQYQFVIVNERHHVGSDRLMSLELLKPLYEKGFRYFALEGYGHEDGINERGYPLISGGYYSNDVIYAQMLRSAAALGFELVGYEIERSQMAPNDSEVPVDRQAERDRVQAENIISRVLEKDPAVKVFIHCGYSHVREVKTSSWSPMAYFLKELTGSDPLTIDQTRLSERSTVSEEHPWRQAAEQRGLIGAQPIVLLDEAGELISDSMLTDIEVLGIRTSYEYGRPSWMRMGGARLPVRLTTPECAKKSCILEAIDPSEDDQAVPYDRVEANRTGEVVLFLPSKSDFNVRIMNLDTQILTLRTVTVP